MTSAIKRTIRPAKESRVQQLRWTRKKYIRLFELGLLGDRKVELIGGAIEVMSPQFDYHAGAISLTLRALESAFGPQYWVRVQATLNLGPGCMPDPDISVLLGSPKGAKKSFPTSALLVVEVSDSTLLRDRGRKGSMYAAHGIADYWIVNLVDNQLEVYRDPQPDASQAFGYAYAQRLTFMSGGSVSPLALPSATIQVDHLLP